jgi:N-acetylneuraminate synthase/sialic acid synthase
MTLRKTPFAILQCSCIYPAPHDVLNIKVIQGYRDRYPDIETGLSTHNPDIHPTVAAFALGGRVFEHHFTVNRRWKGTDNAFSLTPPMMKELRKNIDDVFLALGSSVKAQDPREKAYTDERRKSLYWAASKNQGETISDSDIKIQCPANIMHPADKYTLIGKKINVLKVVEGNPVTEVDVI